MRDFTQGLYSRSLPPIISSSRGMLSFGLFKGLQIFLLTLILTLSSPLILETVFAQTATANVSVASGSLGIVGGHTVPVNVRVDNVTNPSGLAAFTFKISYNPNLISIPDTNSDYIADAGTISVGSFLGSSGKQVRCSEGYIAIDLGDSTKKYLTFTCGTLGSTPAAPTGSGILATINFQTGNIVGLVPLNLVNVALADNTASANLIQNTTTNGSAFVAKCADFTGDHVVRTADILYVVYKYNTNDPAADLDNNGIVKSSDINIAVKEYGQTC